VKPVPAGLESAGKKLWRSVLSVYELAPHELLLLERAARCADRLVKIDGMIAKTTPIVVGAVGQARPSPLYRQALEADLMLCKLLANWRPEDFRGFVRELIRDIKRHGMVRATTRELMPARAADCLAERSPVRGDAGRGGVA
jgi:hypothetical protein